MKGALRTGLKMPLPSVMGILQRIRGAVEVLKYMSERARIDLDANLACDRDQLIERKLVERQLAYLAIPLRQKILGIPS